MLETTQRGGTKGQLRDIEKDAKDTRPRVPLTEPTALESVISLGSCNNLGRKMVAKVVGRSGGKSNDF